jgi:ADP-ribosylglycohydrolase
MRILPLVFYIKDKPIAERYMLTRLVSSLTHGHIRSVICCFYYLEFARLLMEGKDKFEAYKQVKIIVTSQLIASKINPSEIKLLSRLLQEDIYTVTEDSIGSSGYVLHTLEASIWCLLTTDSYKDAVLKAVNLGNDTDTTAAVTGGLAGLFYGYKNIPTKWINTLARSTDIEDLANRLAHKFSNKR